jgi:hypothetical protein
MQYVYDSSRINRRTKRAVPGTGVPCGALSPGEECDLKSFLEVVERMDPSLASLLRETSFAAPSRIFRHAVAGMTFAVGEPPRLHFNSSKDGILLDTEQCITQERLHSFVTTFSWDSGESPQFETRCAMCDHCSPRGESSLSFPCTDELKRFLLSHTLS